MLHTSCVMNEPVFMLGSRARPRAQTMCTILILGDRVLFIFATDFFSVSFFISFWIETVALWCSFVWSMHYFTLRPLFITFKYCRAQSSCCLLSILCVHSFRLSFSVLLPFCLSRWCTCCHHPLTAHVFFSHSCCISVTRFVSQFAQKQPNCIHTAANFPL